MFSPTQTIEMRAEIVDLGVKLRRLADAVDETAPHLPACPLPNCNCGFGGAAGLSTLFEATISRLIRDKMVVDAWMVDAYKANGFTRPHLSVVDDPDG